MGTLDIDGSGINLVLGLRNSPDKSFSLGMVAGFRVFVCDNLAFKSEFFAVARRHTSRVMDRFTETIAIGVDRVQRQFQPMREQVDVWRNHQLPDMEARAILYRAFIEDAVDCPKSLAKEVHRQYFEPEVEEFKPRTLWSRQNSFTGAFKKLEALPMYGAGRVFLHIALTLERGLSALPRLIRIILKGGFLLRAGSPLPIIGRGGPAMTTAELKAFKIELLDDVHELAQDPVADPEAIRAQGRGVFH